MTDDEAVEKLIKAGAKYETREDQCGNERTGWWKDNVWLGPYSLPKFALAALEA